MSSCSSRACTHPGRMSFPRSSGEDGAFGPYSLGESNAIKGNFIRRAASWGRPGTAGYLQSLNALGGRRVVATVLMPDARLFSLTATCAAGAREAAAPSVAAPAASDDDDGKPLTIMTVLIDDVGAALPCHTLDLPPHSTNPSPSVDPAGRRRLGRHRDPQPLLPDSSSPQSHSSSSSSESPPVRLLFRSPVVTEIQRMIRVDGLVKRKRLS